MCIICEYGIDLQRFIFLVGGRTATECRKVSDAFLSRPDNVAPILRSLERMGKLQHDFLSSLGVEEFVSLFGIESREPGDGIDEEFTDKWVDLVVEESVRAFKSDSYRPTYITPRELRGDVPASEVN